MDAKRSSASYQVNEMAKPVFAKAIGAALAVALAWAQMPSAATAQGKREVSALPAAFAETVREVRARARGDR